jgi:membrane protein YqaA with SNARE-associated domain
VSAAAPLASLFLVCVAGGFVWLFNAEAAAVAYGGMGRWHPALVGVTCAAGQVVSYTVLFFGGGWLLARWRQARERIERTRVRYGARLERSFLALTASGALVGLPPMTVLAAIAGGFRVRYPALIAIAFCLRFVRFTVLALAGNELVALWRSLAARAGCG